MLRLLTALFFVALAASGCFDKLAGTTTASSGEVSAADDATQIGQVLNSLSADMLSGDVTNVSSIFASETTITAPPAVTYTWSVSDMQTQLSATITNAQFTTYSITDRVVSLSTSTATVATSVDMVGRQSPDGAVGERLYSVGFHFVKTSSGWRIDQEHW